MGNRRMWKRRSVRLGRVGSELAVHVVEALGAFVVRRERVVINRPPWRHAFHVLDRLEIFPPKAIEHAAPELRVAADVVMSVRAELLAPLVDPPLIRLIAELFPDGFGIPVLVFLRDE